jgi:RNA polymerase sigma factor (sigma-70 family)
MPLTATPPQETAAPTRRPHHGTLSTCTLRHASDDGLVALTRAGSERAFAEIMRRYQRPLQFYCMHLVGAPRAEDAVQQAFMQAFVSLRDGARREIALRPWLYRIARNCAIDMLRKQPFDHDELDPEFDGVPQTPGVFEQKEELARVVAAIQALPEGQRRALTLRELEGRSYGEISAELGHTDSGVRQLIFRARTALRNLGAMLMPFGSLRWRLAESSSSSAVADPHQVAVAATVSSTGGGSALQAAASAVAATVTLLATGAPHERHGVHAATSRTTRAIVQPLATGPAILTSTVIPVTARAGERKRGRHQLDVGGPAPAPSSDLVAAPVALAAPVTPAVPPVASLPVDPPSVLTLTDLPGIQGPVSAGALGGSGVSATSPVAADASLAVASTTASSGATLASKPPAVVPVKPVLTPVAANPVVPAPVKPSAPKVVTPKVDGTKAVLPKATSPKAPVSPKAPSVPVKPATPKKPAVSKTPPAPLLPPKPAA